MKQTTKEAIVGGCLLVVFIVFFAAVILSLVYGDR